MEEHCTSLKVVRLDSSFKLSELGCYLEFKSTVLQSSQTLYQNLCWQCLLHISCPEHNIRLHIFVSIGSIFYCFNRSVQKKWPTKFKFDWPLGKIGLKIASGQLLLCALLAYLTMWAVMYYCRICLEVWTGHFSGYSR